MKQQERERAEAIEILHKLIKEGDTVYTSLKHVSNSGMFRVIQVLICKDDHISDISGLVCKALCEKYNQKHGGVPASGCGMDMGFNTVYSLSYQMFKNGFQCIGEEKRCPANDHSNGDQNYQPHLHKDGGYALRQRWI